MGGSARPTHGISAAPWRAVVHGHPVRQLQRRSGSVQRHQRRRVETGHGHWDSGGQIGITVRAQGLEETSVQDLISPPSGANLLSALGDIGGFRHDSLTVVPSTMFTSPTLSTNTAIDFAELSPGFIVRVGN